MSVVETKKEHKACSCDYCVDQYFNFTNDNQPCPSYQPPELKDAMEIA